MPRRRMNVLPCSLVPLSAWFFVERSYGLSLFDRRVLWKIAKGHLTTTSQTTRQIPPVHSTMKSYGEMRKCSEVYESVVGDGVGGDLSWSHVDPCAPRIALKSSSGGTGLAVKDERAWE